MDCGDMSPLSLRRGNVPDAWSCPAIGVCPACSQSGVMPPHSKHARGESTHPLDCAGRAERRRRFRAHHDPGNLPRGSRVPKRCRASLATALQNTPGEPTRPMDCGDMSPLSLRRGNVLNAWFCPAFGVCPARSQSGVVPPHSKTRPANPHTLWTAPAERSGDGAFARTTIPGTSNADRAFQSGVALRLPPHSKIRPVNPHALWTAPAERSDDGAFARTTIPGTSNADRAFQSGVALRLPPHSKIRPVNPHALWTAVTCHRFRYAAGMFLTRGPVQRSVYSQRAAKAASCRRTPKHALWTAPAERRVDGAFARTTIPGNSNACRAFQSGVALRLPPHSKRPFVVRHSPFHSLAFDRETF
jgi:hypothetical protein